jgi:glutaredoxin
MNATRTVEQVDKEIAELQQRLQGVTGTKTEVYTRIVGYYRSVANWNKGKREEYDYRKLFSEPKDMMKHGSRQPEFAEKEMGTGGTRETAAASYTFFYRGTCPNCPPVKEYVNKLSIPGSSVDVDTSEGMDSAIEHQVLASPTVIFFDVQGHEVFRGNDTETMEKVFSPAKVGIS